MEEVFACEKARFGVSINEVNVDCMQEGVRQGGVMIFFLFSSRT